MQTARTPAERKAFVVQEAQAAFQKTPASHSWPSAHGRGRSFGSSSLTLVFLALFASGYTWKAATPPLKRPEARPLYAALIAEALKERDLPRAAKFLQAARLCWQKEGEGCGFTRGQYLRWMGIFFLETSQASLAVEIFDRALLARAAQPPQLPTRPVGHQGHTTSQAPARPSGKREGLPRNEEDLRLLHFYKGQALFQMGRWGEAAEALLKAEGIGKDIVGWHLRLGQAYARGGEGEKARQALERGLLRFPAEVVLLQASARLYAEAGFFQTAIRLAWRGLGRSGDLSVFFLIADRLERSRLGQMHLSLLESLRLAFPRHPELLQRLALAYTAAKMPHAAALIFGRLALERPEMAFFAAEAFRSAGDLRQARAWNLRIPDAHKRISQRAMLFLSEGAYLRVYALLLPLWKAGRLEAQDRYHLAYAALRSGQYDLLPPLLSSLQGTAQKHLLPSLQKALAACRASPWLCL